MSIKFNQKGDTIIEVLFAMTIIGIVLASAYSVASRNLQVSQLTKERSLATELASAQIDQLKNLSEDITTDIPASGEFCLDLTQATYIIDSAPPDSACIYDNLFKRSIVKNGDEYKITVSWVPAGEGSGNQSVVELVYKDYNFDLVSSSGVAISVVSAGSGSAILGVNILDTSNVKDSGVLLGTTSNPFVNSPGVILLFGSDPTNGSYQVNASFDPGETWYARVFVILDSGLVLYSSVTTVDNSVAVGGVPQVNTLAHSAVTQSSATITGDIPSTGGTSITECGIVFNTSTAPLKSDDFRTSTDCSGNFTKTITGLAPSTTYYARAYATNTYGTTYGSSTEQVFTTLAVPSGLTYEASLGGSSYYLSDSPATVSEARAVAAASGGHLVTIRSQAENNLVSAMAGGNYIWIGANDLDTEGTWVWEDTGEVFFIDDASGGSAVSGAYTRWRNGEPNDHNAGVPGEDAAVMNWGGSNSGFWNDWYDNATSTAYYVIEYD